MMYIGAVFGGPELADAPIEKAIRLIGKARGPIEKSDSGALDIVFHVPGSLLKPEFTGVRTAKFSRKERMLMLQIAVPEEQVHTPDVRWLLDAIREAVRLARPKFERAGIGYPEQEHLAIVDRIQMELLK
ncbi:hypothetical protein D7X99_16180 [Corallococcus sp. AB032C]|uniref:hypothetical protein n=1 Tax=Corallococcus TaxID=83461 RepID=UPI000EB87942|nr:MULTISPECIES: hypothetical protein [Corallococcus]NNB87772.1 hypothetical protein [Corallococcus exiguus]NPC47844.1 hypothetical protein [Corallococcus exiguus]RKH82300.1 hypothetical protein D7X99_16180 [Corallococcus sp. AB032C]